jgi:hypothetical protein
VDFRPLAFFRVLAVLSSAASCSMSLVHAHAAVGTARLSPRDTSLNINNRNYSADSVLMTYTWPDNQVANAIVLKFDLSALPPKAVVHDAKLHLALVTADATSDSNYTVTANKIVTKNPIIEAATGYTADGGAQWTPNACCYNGVPLAQADISPPENTQAIDRIPGYKSWTITTMVQEWLADPATNRGVLLNSDPSKPRDRFRYFASMENPDAARRPYLEVEYSVPLVDTTPPSVTITAPVDGARVASTVSLAANATDDVGVAGVQFQVDGVNLGSVDAAPPYSIGWDTTTAVDGPHTLTAIAHDAAGNEATSGPVSVTVAAGTSDGPLVFESNWATATGSSPVAVTDGGKWPNYWEWNSVGAHLLSVVPGGPDGHNALRVQQRGPTYAAAVQNDNFMPPSTDYYVRYYMKTDDTSSSGDHVVSTDIWHYQNLTYMRKYGGATGYVFEVSVYGCGYTYPISRWKPAQRLANGQWYRFEYFVDYRSANQIQVHPRVYDAAGNLILSDADLRQSDYGSTNWNGRSDWTLASYYAAGHTFCVDPTWMNDFGMGNNGQAGASATGQYWYFAGVQIRQDTWPGPVESASGGADATPPTISLTAPAAGSTVSGTQTVSATAADNIGVVGVQFEMDGNNLGSEDTGPPYSVAWDTTTTADGIHSIAAVARDAAGNQTTSAARTVTVSNAAPPPAGGIAARYPSDIGIETDPDVIFVETFEEATLTDLFNRWTQIRNDQNMTFSTDVPPGSTGRSMNIPWTGGATDGGHLYKVLSPAVDDTLYVRYYIKYPTSGRYRHDGIWVGGRNPVTNWPDPQAGTKPAGNDRFMAAAEQSDDSSHFDHYDYWMDMHVHGDGKYWGNMLLMDPNVTVPRGQWTCIEHMVKLNNPVSASNGEHAIWINGVKVSQVGQGFPNGTWTGGNFTQTSTGSPFEGLRWRSDANLRLNWIWLQNYSPDDPAGFTSSLKFDHVVVARNYIGCLSTAPPS